MKLVIRQYLESLKERGELDALIPDLLSQMGLEVFLRPGIGARQYGVDVAAVGKLRPEEDDKVFLFSIKSGDIGRRDWDAGNPQDLRPSIIEILDVFIPAHIPSEHKDKPIVICMCFGGEIKEEVRQNISLFENKHQTSTISFSEWNGDRISSLIEISFLKEELLPENTRTMLRKSLAMLDEPNLSFRHFSRLAYKLAEAAKSSPKKALTSIRQMHLCTWILFSWCREENNIESAYLASELVLLKGWEICKQALSKTDKASVGITTTFDALFSLHMQVASHYCERIILPHSGHLHALSSAVSPSCSVDVALKLFDVVGRLSSTGIWVSWHAKKVEADHPADAGRLRGIAIKYQQTIKKIIVNNPVLFSPPQDENAIDIAIATLFLSLDIKNKNDINNWHYRLLENIYFSFQANLSYPATISSYHDLIQHPRSSDAEYRESVTQGSILYPFLAISAAIFDSQDNYLLVQRIKNDFLAHCNFQAYFFDESSEEHLYSNGAQHGATLSDVGIEAPADDLIKEIEFECGESSYFRELSAVQCSFWPLVLIACRHYRLPVPLHLFIDIHRQMNGDSGAENFS